MATIFTDDDDVQLFRIAKMFSDAGNPVDWDYTWKKLKKRRFSRAQLQGRLKTLKQRWGLDLNKFPLRFTKQHARTPVSRRPVLPIVTTAQPPAPLIEPSTAPMSSEVAWKSVAEIFGSVPRALVLQPANAVHQNVGEVVPASITKVLAALAPVVADDVFVDVGAGVGNVVTQVALESKASVCIGIEMRQELVLCGQRLMSQSMHPALRKVRFIASKFEDVDVHNHPDIKRATILYSFCKLFLEPSLLCLEVLVCELPQLKALVLSTNPCSRHRGACKREFCLLWDLVHEMAVSTSYSSSEIKLYVYKRKR